jgi:2,3-bisphosphoglycerate-independent phosphoglycerate mutase
MSPAPRHILLLFVDGLGIGDADEGCNPCCHSHENFRHYAGETFPKALANGGTVLGLDANLDMPGLPQSATGQTALLTGVNAAAAIGRHLNGFPNQALRDIIAQHSILKTVHERGYRAAFLNTFRPPFFDYNPFVILRHLSVTTVSNLYAGLPFFNLDDLRSERAIYQDLTGEALIANGFDVPVFTPEQAGSIVARRCRDFHFSLFEYFQTDRAGHSLHMERALGELRKLELFLTAVLEHTDLSDTLILLTSDHGNIENICVKGHTRNPAMTLVFGCGHADYAQRLTSILDVTPLFLELLP